MNGNMQHYNNLKVVPKNALREISFGKLKGKSDISPQWRYEAMTSEFGTCGLGWKFEIVDTSTRDLADGQTMLFVKVNLYIKTGEEWSEPIPGYGGDFLIVKDKNGTHGNDEAYKMATTDALGTAMKMLGVAADVYRGLADDSKYGREPAQPAQQQQKQKTTPPAPAADDKKQLLIRLMHHAKESGLSTDDIKQLMLYKFKAAKSDDLSVAQINDLLKNSGRYWNEFLDAQVANEASC